jgi:ubiquinone/menaquinone biosynthesis C-methylase UbiE
MDSRITDQWEANAAEYTTLVDGRGTPHHRKILNPCVEQLLGDVTGKRLLDAGCGEGYLSEYYAQQGADVVGVDISEKMIAICEKRSKRQNLAYFVGDVCNLHLFQESSFDLVLCNLVLLNVPCYERALQEFYRILRYNGLLVFSVVHPAFNVFGPGRWELGEKSSDSGRRKGRYFILDNYFEEKEYVIRWKTRTGTPFPQQFSFFHRTIGTYVNALSKAGFRLTNLEEPRPIGDDSFFERERRVPFFLVFRAQKTEII